MTITLREIGREKHFDLKMRFAELGRERPIFPREAGNLAVFLQHPREGWLCPALLRDREPDGAQEVSSSDDSSIPHLVRREQRKNQ